MSNWYSELETIVRLRTQASISSVKNQFGLQWSSIYYNRIVPYQLYLLLDDDGDFSRVKNRYQTELSWNILNCGFIIGKNRISEYKVDGKLILTDAKINMQTDYIDKLIVENNLRYQQVVDYLSWLKVNNLSLLQRTEVCLLENAQSSSNKLLDIMTELFKNEQNISTNVSSINTVRGLAYYSIDTVAVHVDALLNEIKVHNYNLVKLDLSSELLSYKMKQISFWSSVNLSPFLRFGVYDMVGGERQGAIDMGVSLRVPLSFEQSKLKRVLKDDQKILAYKRNFTYKQFEEEILRNIHDLSIINKTMIIKFEQLKKMRKLLLNRSNAYQRVSGEYSRPDRIREYNAYISCFEEVVSLEYKRDSIIIRLQGYLSDSTINSFIEYLQIS